MKRIECRLLHLEIIKDAENGNPIIPIHTWALMFCQNEYIHQTFAKTPTVDTGDFNIHQIPPITVDAWRTPIPQPERIREASNSNLTSAINGVINGD